VHKQMNSTAQHSTAHHSTNVCVRVCMHVLKKEMSAVVRKLSHSFFINTLYSHTHTYTLKRHFILLRIQFQ